MLVDVNRQYPPDFFDWMDYSQEPVIAVQNDDIPEEIQTEINQEIDENYVENVSLAKGDIERIGEEDVKPAVFLERKRGLLSDWTWSLLFGLVVMNLGYSFCWGFTFLEHFCMDTRHPC